MTPALLMACIWAVAANVIGLFPSRHKHWPAAYALIAVGLPILAFVFVQNGPLTGLIVLACAASILRWPVRYLWRWMRRITGMDAGLTAD